MGQIQRRNTSPVAHKESSCSNRMLLVITIAYTVQFRKFEPSNFKIRTLRTPAQRLNFREAASRCKSQNRAADSTLVSTTLNATATRANRNSLRTHRDEGQKVRRLILEERGFAWVLLTQQRLSEHRNLG